MTRNTFNVNFQLIPFMLEISKDWIACLNLVEMKDLKKFRTKCGSKGEDGDLNDLNIAFWRSKFHGKNSRSWRSNSCGEPSKSVEVGSLSLCALSCVYISNFRILPNFY